MPIFKTKDSPESIKKAQEYLKRSGLDCLQNADDINIARDVANDMSLIDIFSISNVFGKISEQDFYKIRMLHAITLQNNLVIRQLERLNKNIEHLNNSEASDSQTVITDHSDYKVSQTTESDVSDREKDLRRRLGYYK